MPWSPSCLPLRLGMRTKPDLHRRIALPDTVATRHRGQRTPLGKVSVETYTF